MRVLIIGVNEEHQNTMHWNFYSALSAYMDVDFFGPGYNDAGILQKGLQRYIDSKEAYDIIILTWAIVNQSIKYNKPSDIYARYRYTISNYYISESLRYSHLIIREVLQIKHKHKVLAFYEDIVDIKDKTYKKICSILDRGFYFMCNGTQFAPRLNEENSKRFFGAQINNNLHRIDEAYHERFISMPIQAASLDEFYYGPLSERNCDCIIPGNVGKDGYPDRIKIFKILKKNGCSVWDEAYDRTMAYRTSRLTRKRSVIYNSPKDKFVNAYILKYPNVYINQKIRPEEWGKYHENYRFGIRNSKMAYADAGIGKALVRKYTEIPAAGTLLLCDEVAGLHEYGFVDGENCIIVSPDNIFSVVKDLCRDPERMQSVADKGRNLVLKKHTVMNRARNVLKAFERINENQFYGSHWKDGDFILE